MIVKDLTYAMRNLGRNKLLSAINVLGLSVGISSCLIIFLIVNYELSFDRFQPDGPRIFRVYSQFSGDFNSENRGVSTGIPTAMRQQFSGLAALASFHTFRADVKVPVSGRPAKDLGENADIIITDSEYFNVFRYYNWVAGSPEQSLTQPFQVVLTRSRAKTYFGDRSPQDLIGREIQYQDSLSVYVSGIVSDIQERTDLNFTDFISAATVEKSWLKTRIVPDDWQTTNSSSQLFIRLSDGTTAEKIEAQMPGLTKVLQSKQTDPGWAPVIKLQPLADVHFNTELGIFDHSRSVAEKSTLQILAVVAVLLLLMAAVNFINLETAQASRRAKEVGVRKVLGSPRRKLVTRFLTESFLLSLCAVIVSLGIAELSLPFLSEFIPAGLALDLTDGRILLFLVGLVLVITFLAGFYPAFLLSSLQPALALKNAISSNSLGSRTSFIRKALTVFQFSFSQILILATITIGFQLHYMLNKDLGFNADAVLEVSTPWWENSDKRSQMRNQLASIPEIDIFTIQRDLPTSTSWSSSIMEFANGKEILKHRVYVKLADTSYLAVYGLKLIAGRNLIPNDSAREYVINETYMRALGFDSPWDVLGKTVNKEFSIVGVVKDFHNKTLHSPIEPTVIQYTSDAHSFGIRLNTPRTEVVDVGPALHKIETAWKKIYPEEKFEYHFFNDAVKRFYENEQRIGKLCRMATIIAILISCLGLFGLSSFTVVQRSKEIGIRKVLGATVNSIVLLLSRDFLMLVGIAFLVSTPVAYAVAGRWLQDFAYKMDLSVWVFVLSGALSILVAFITISFRTVRAAKSDPVKSLRYE